MGVCSPAELRAARALAGSPGAWGAPGGGAEGSLGDTSLTPTKPCSGEQAQGLLFPKHSPEGPRAGRSVCENQSLHFRLDCLGAFQSLSGPCVQNVLTLRQSLWCLSPVGRCWASINFSSSATKYLSPWGRKDSLMATGRGLWSRACWEQTAPSQHQSRDRTEATASPWISPSLCSQNRSLIWQDVNKPDSPPSERRTSPRGGPWGGQAEKVSGSPLWSARHHIHTANCSVFKVSLSLGKVFLFPTQGSLISHMLHDVKALTFTCSCLSSHPEVTTTYLLPTLSPRGVSQQKCHIVYCALSEFDLENVTAKSICHGREANSYWLTVQPVKHGVGKTPSQHLVTVPSCRTTYVV